MHNSRFQARRSESWQHQFLKLSVIVLLCASLGLFASFGPKVEIKSKIGQSTGITGSTLFTLQDDPSGSNNTDDDECIGQVEFDEEFPGQNYCHYLGDHCGDALLNYMEFYYCSDVPHALLWVLGILEVALLFFYLGKAADTYFCPVLDIVANVLKMSDEVAGLTILALGNGAPDIAATFSAVVANSYDIAIGELFGGAFFVTTVVVGLVSLVSDAEVNRYDFFKDIITLLVVGCGVLLMTHFGEITLWQACLLLIVYFSYIGVSLGVHYYYLWKNKNDNTSRNYMKGNAINDESYEGLLDSVTQLDDDVEEDEFFSWASWKEKWDSKPLFSKIFYGVIFPIRAPLLLTTPNVNCWNRGLNSLIPITGPLVILLSLHKVTATFNVLGIAVPIVAVTSFSGLLVSVLLFFTSTWESKPRYFLFYVVLALVFSITWIYLAANELVAVLQAVGLTLGISEVILGATVLAWGNSLGDLVADVVMARHGAPRMAIAACYGGPVFNLLVGLGTSLTYATISKPIYSVKSSNIFLLTAGFLIGALVISLIVVPLMTRYVIVKPMGGFLIVFYVVYCVLAVLVAVGVIWPEDNA